MLNHYDDNKVETNSLIVYRGILDVKPGCAESFLTINISFSCLRYALTKGGLTYLCDSQCLGKTSHSERQVIKKKNS